MADDSERRDAEPKESKPAQGAEKAGDSAPNVSASKPSRAKTAKEAASSKKSRPSRSGASKAKKKAPAKSSGAADSGSKSATKTASAKPAARKASTWKRSAKPSTGKTDPPARAAEETAAPAPSAEAAGESAPETTVDSVETPAKASEPAANAVQPPAAPATVAEHAAPSAKAKSSGRARLPGPEIKRAAKKAPKKTTTQEKLATAEQKPVDEGVRPLDGIRVLDLSRLLPGPYASHILASFGAEVIKIERPGEGDYMRGYDPKSQGVNAAFLTINRGKKSFAVDLKHPDGKEAFVALAKQADVLLDGFRPGVMERLGLGYEQLSEANPRLVYAALTGYGQTGPRANQAGHDLNYMALAGMLDLLGESGGMPAVPGVQIADVAAGALPTVIGILLALQNRTRTDKGQMVDIAMFDSILGLMPVQVANYTATKRRPKRGHERLFGRYACYNIYPVRNGRYVAVGALEPKFWKALCTAMNRPDLIEDQYVEGDAQEILKAELTRTFQKKDVAEWMEIFAEEDVCVTEVREISRVAQDDAVAERGMVTPVRGKGSAVYEQLGVFPKLSETPGYIAGEAPVRGEHTGELLATLDYPSERIEELVGAGAVEQPDAE